MRAALFALALLLVPVAARAHPHVLIDSHLVFLFEAGKIVGLQMGWKFDPVYSGSLVQDFDADKNGALSPTEIASIEKDAFQDTRQFQYFTFADIDGHKVQWPVASDFKVLVHKDALLYAFRLTLPHPVDPRQQKFKVSTYEESFYIDIDIPNAAAVKLIGEGSQGCRAEIGEDKSNPLLGGIAFPKKVDIRCD
ncbi:DUF1007 family protein [Magnetospirillum sulfuroxidans]|uniref:DUF1007 family protein n=1 Tax=Magnetospirillum sulfuroxidans TaxID=611300 RepID=A0ABS5ID57_9PROT|nr:DUF1007 family protein [Magnetospirillum sulfuroxidans]MBR9972274.1 DUF1007 family protein [Magnetospirillum sulfuroxidans]